MSINKLTMARAAVGSLIVGSAPGKISTYTVSPIEVAGIRVFTSGTITPGGILTATVYTTTVTAAGVAAGDAIVVIPPAAIATGVTWSAYVSAANTITLRLANPTASTVTPAAATWSFLHFALAPGNN